MGILVIAASALVHAKMFVTFALVRLCEWLGSGDDKLSEYIAHTSSAREDRVFSCQDCEQFEAYHKDAENANLERLMRERERRSRRRLHFSRILEASNANDFEDVEGLRRVSHGN